MIKNNLIQLAIGKIILSHSKIRYMIVIERKEPLHIPITGEGQSHGFTQDATHNSFYGMLTFRQCGPSGLTPTRHEYRIYLATPDDKTIGAPLERTPAVFRTTPQEFMFLNKSQVQIQAENIIRSYTDDLNNK